MTSSGHIKSFQRHIKEKMARTLMAGFAIGSMMEKKILVSLAPSTRADSISSLGTLRKYCRNRKTPLPSRRNDKACKGVVHSKKFDYMEDGNHQHFQRQHQGGNEKDKQHFAALKIVLGKGIARHGVDDNRQDGGQHRNNGTVEKISAKVAFFKGMAVIVQGKVFGEKGGGIAEHLRPAFKGREHNPKDGKDEQKGK